MPNAVIDLLDAGIARAGSPVCVGLDPVLELLPEPVRSNHHDPLGALAEFSHGVLRSAAAVVPAVKFQSACFERYGSRGVALLEECTVEAARLGMVVIWDAKRGDIGTTSAHYAAAAKRLGAHFVTVNGYLGRSGLTPFLDAGLGVFVLVRTSNPDSDEIQEVKLADGRTVAEMMADGVRVLGADVVGASGLSAVGAVVGATKAADAVALRGRMPNQVFLIPGYGAQGGTAADLKNMLRPDGRGILVTASRSVIYPKSGTGDWKQNVAEAAALLAAEVAGVVRG